MSLPGPGLVIYSKPGCHLCEDMKAAIWRLTSGRPPLREVDITHDPDLAARYGFEIPVLFLDGRLIAKHRLEPERLRRTLAERRVTTDEPTGA